LTLTVSLLENDVPQTLRAIVRTVFVPTPQFRCVVFFLRSYPSRLRIDLITYKSIQSTADTTWNFKDPLLAEDYLKRWYFWATHSRLNPVIDTAKAIKGHWNGVLNYINTRIDNGVLEGINSLIQSAKDDGRGFRTTKNFIITIYLRLGKLKFNLPT
jgi:transposase